MQLRGSDPAERAYDLGGRRLGVLSAFQWAALFGEQSELATFEEFIALTAPGESKLSVHTRRGWRPAPPTLDPHAVLAFGLCAGVLREPQYAPGMDLGIEAVGCRFSPTDEVGLLDLDLDGKVIKGIDYRPDKVLRALEQIGLQPHLVTSGSGGSPVATTPISRLSPSAWRG